MYAGLLSRFHEKGARRAIRANRLEEAGRRYFKAVRLNPTDEDLEHRALNALEKAHLWDQATAVLDARRDDPHQNRALRRSYHDEQREGPPPSRRFVSGAHVKLAVFNDTDYRPNIGCRLTSRGLKLAIAAAFPDVETASMRFNFRSLRDQPAKATTSLSERLEHALARGFGADAIATIRAADLVVLQPEGSLDADIPLAGLANIFAPVLYAAALGKRSAILNGTIPAFEGARDRFVRGAFEAVGKVAGRDRLTSRRYDVVFLPDAALLHAFDVEDAVGADCLITTGARNTAADDHAIAETALAIADAARLRPVMLSRNSRRAIELRAAIEARGGVFAETASLDAAARLIARCRLHVGARYHMAVLAHLCGAPSVLFNVQTGKNEWLSEFTDTIALVAPGDGRATGLADALLKKPRVRFAGQAALAADYVKFLTEALRDEPRRADIDALVGFAYRGSPDG